MAQAIFDGNVLKARGGRRTSFNLDLGREQRIYLAPELSQMPSFRDSDIVS